MGTATERQLINTIVSLRFLPFSLSSSPLPRPFFLKNDTVQKENVEDELGKFRHPFLCTPQSCLGADTNHASLAQDNVIREIGLAYF